MDLRIAGGLEEKTNPTVYDLAFAGVKRGDYLG